MIIRALETREEGKEPLSIYCTWRSYNNISDQVKLSVIAAEDQNFPYHYGFDIKAIEKAMEHNKRGRSIRGASTISQQVAKNVFLWNGRSWIRKGLEVYFTLLIETLWSKERILQMYLNVAEMGDGVFGVEAASQQFFNKSANDISKEQAARLAGVLPNPRLYSAKNPGPYMRRRTNWILRAMRQLGGTSYLEQL